MKVNETSSKSLSPCKNESAIIKRRNFIKGVRKYRILLLFVVPSLVVTLVFSYFPIYGILMAFQDYNVVDGLLHSKWVGLENFRMLVGDRDFGRVLVNTLRITVLRLLLGFPAPIILALLLNELKNIKFRKVIQTVSYLPHFISWVVVAGFVYSFLGVDSDFNVAVARLLNIEPIPFLSQAKYFPWLVVLCGIWKETGFNAIVYLAALSSIDPNLIEAGRIDGAGKWKLTLHVTLPAIIPTAVMLFILSIGGLMSAGFDEVWNLQNDTIRSNTHVLDTYTYMQGLYYARYSFGTAVGLFNGIIGFILVYSTNRISRKISEISLW